jgi:hypothetical protein
MLYPYAAETTPGGSNWSEELRRSLGIGNNFNFVARFVRRIGFAIFKKRPLLSEKSKIDDRKKKGERNNRFIIEKYTNNHMTYMTLLREEKYLQLDI